MSARMMIIHGISNQVSFNWELPRVYKETLGTSRMLVDSKATCFPFSTSIFIPSTFGPFPFSSIHVDRGLKSAGQFDILEGFNHLIGHA